MPLSADERALIQKTHDTVVQLAAALKERCPRHEEQIKSLDLMMRGPPGNGSKPGVLTRVTLLEKWQGRHIWGVRTAVGGVVALTVSLLAVWVKGWFGR